jgi:acetyl-CoA synthetase
MKNSFSWEKVMKEFDWNPLEKFNMGHECCDRWADDPSRVALYHEDYLGNKETWTYKRLKDRSNQMANKLSSLGVQKGDRVAGLLGKDMELFITVLAVWKLGAIYVPMFTAFGPDAISYRLMDAGCKVVLTNKEQAEKLPKEGSLTVILTDLPTDQGFSFYEDLNSFSINFETEQTKLDEPAVIQFTSGSTGMPKGAAWSHKILLSVYPYVKYAVAIEENDIFLGGADPGWAYGLMNCTFSPLSLGIPTVIYKGPFQVETYYRLMESYHVTNLAYAPTAYRMMMAEGEKLIQKYNLKVRKFSSAGEPLNAEVVRFFEKNFGRSIYDHYGATETGMIVNNYNCTDMVVKPGSMGLPMPGFNVALVDEKGYAVAEGETGQIAIDATDFPFFFLDYWQDEAKTQSKRVGKWFLTGDMANQDEDGYFWFQGRSDDIISSAGYRIGPFEVESSLIEHDAVVEAAVVGKPDATKGEIVKAYVVLHPNYQPSEQLAEVLKIFVKSRLSKHQYPREIEFINELPKTQSGKIQRFLLKKVHELKI